MNDRNLLFFVAGGLVAYIYFRHELDTSPIGKINQKVGGVLF